MNGHGEINSEQLNREGCEFGRSRREEIKKMQEDIEYLKNWLKLGITGIIGMFFTVIVMLSRILWG